jgi:hypothetical protein
MKIELTIKVDYLPSWGLMEGVRELLQNAKDAETEFNAPMTVRVRDSKGDAGVLVIENEGCTMPYEALLLGHSTKAERGDLIGKFGEGFKLGILALLRAGHSVKIRNGSEVWTPEIVWSEKFAAKVLAFDIQKGRKEDARIAIEVGGISAEFFATEIKPRFLWLGKEIAGNERVNTDYGSLLLAPAQKGRIFVKGILVESKPDLAVGYDLDDCEVDRDRRMVSSFDFSWKTRCIWQGALAARPDLFDAYLDIIEENGPEAKNLDTYAAGRLPEAFVDHVAARFRTQYGSKAVPVSNMGESQDLEHNGRTGVVVNPAMRAVLEKSMGTLATVQEALKNEVVRTYGWHELTEAQKASLLRAIALVNAVTPVTLAEINVVDFRSANLMGTFGADDGVKVSAKVAEDRAKCLETLVHEVAHRTGGDGEHSHVAEIERIWSRIVENLTTA